MLNLRTQILSCVFCVSLLALVLACGSGGGGISTSSSTSGAVELRTVSGTIADAEASAVISSGSEATYNFAQINAIKFVDELNNTYVASVTNGYFTINLPVDLVYTFALMVNNEPVASLSYNNASYFKLQSGDDGLSFGSMQVNVTTKSAVPENDPWEGHFVSVTVVWTDADSDGMPDIFSNDSGLVITNTSLSTGAAGYEYSEELAASGGKSPYTWTIYSGSLPAGLELDSETGEIYGTPTTKGTSTFDIRVTDSEETTFTRSFTLIIDQVVITTTDLRDGDFGGGYQVQFEASGGTGTYQWALVSGSLPPDLEFTSTGLLIGGIMQSTLSFGTHSFTVRATDTASHSGEKNFSITVNGTAGQFAWISNSIGADGCLPVITDAYAYYTRSDGHILCSDSTRNSLKWAYNIGGKAREMRVIGDMLYAINTSGKIVCLNAATGAQIWEYNNGISYYMLPPIVDGRVYTEKYLGKIDCLDAATGNLIWEYDTGVAYSITPSVYDGKVYVTDNLGKLYCLDTADGTKLWDAVIAAGSAKTPVMVANNYLYVVMDSTKLKCLNPADGALVWEFVSANTVDDNPHITSENVFLYARDKLYILNALTGAKNQEITAAGYFFKSVAADSSFVYAGTSQSGSTAGDLRCYSIATGTEEWVFNPWYSVNNTPVLANGYIYVARSQTKMYCVKASTGEKIWEYDCGSGSWTDAIVVNGFVYAGSGYGMMCLYAPESK